MDALFAYRQYQQPVPNLRVSPQGCSSVDFLDFLWAAAMLVNRPSGAMIAISAARNVPPRRIDVTPGELSFQHLRHSLTHGEFHPM
jgi:hypothetical protein